MTCKHGRTERHLIDGVPPGPWDDCDGKPDAPAHECNWNSAWPTGHPLPPEDPARLQGPEVGEFVVYTPKSSILVNGVPQPPRPPVIVRVIQRSYVWSPGECRSKGGYRHYDWKVIEEGPDEYRTLVVDDTDLSPIPEQHGRKAAVRLVYDVRGYDWSALLKGKDPEESL